MPSAIGRSKRPPSFGRSAGARFTVIRPAGNSKREFSSAARTRPLLSFTTVAGRPTIQNAGSPLARLTSTCTRGACSPTCARQATRATAMLHPTRCALRLRSRLRARRARTRRRADRGRGRPRAFERGQTRLERLKLRPGSLEYPRLRVELVPGHEVELAEPLAQHGAEVVLEILLHAAQRRGHTLEQTAREL